MCDQDHFEHDQTEFEALGLVTRKQFGVMLPNYSFQPNIKEVGKVSVCDVVIVRRVGEYGIEEIVRVSQRCSRLLICLFIMIVTNAN